jgi:hypothetical protein
LEDVRADFASSQVASFLKDFLELVQADFAGGAPSPFPNL